MQSKEQITSGVFKNALTAGTIEKTAVESVMAVVKQEQINKLKTMRPSIGIVRPSAIEETI